jgi:peptidoglycan/LPS O-acetylase OafA/YrhL
MTYINKIDALRAFAVLMVVMSHWVPKSSAIIPFGEIGVDIFFVISGFLITRILLTEKDIASGQNNSMFSVLQNFVSRRALRIFPIYYLSLVFFWLLQPLEGYHIRENIVYYVTYTVNILFFDKNGWDSYLAPLWSLAVEEQFYLVWPLLMILVPSKHIFKIITGSILIGLIFPYFFDREMVKVLTPSCLNALGGGALLAWMMVRKPEILDRHKIIFLIVVVIALVVLCFSIAQGKPGDYYPQLRTVIALFSMVTVMYCMGIYKPVRMLEIIMNFSGLIWIGRISYGIYLYHNLISIVWRNFLVAHISGLSDLIGVTYSNTIFLLAKLLLLLAFSWLSYVCIEKPFLDLKKHFILRQKPQIV